MRTRRADGLTIEEGEEVRRLRREVSLKGRGPDLVWRTPTTDGPDRLAVGDRDTSIPGPTGRRPRHRVGPGNSLALVR
jgi:hypothetical protein